MLGRIIFEDSPADEGISAVIEFARFADMCGLLDIEHLMAQRIQDVVIADAAHRHGLCETNHNANTYSITSQHIISAVNLPVGHPVRNTLAMAAVEGFLLLEDHKFSKEYREIPGFAADLLAAVRETVKTISHGQDPLLFRAQDVHNTIFSRSLQSMSRVLRRDVYWLGAPGITIDQVKQPDPDPLAPVRYSCLY